MAYQPIQLPTAQGFGIADAVMAARQEQRQKQQDAWQQIIQQGQAERAQQELALRQQQQAFHQAQAQHEQQQADQERTLKLHSMIGELHEKGLSHEAQQIAGMFGLTPQTQDRGLMPMEPTKPEPAQQPEFVGPLETPEDAAARAAMDVQGVGKQQGPATEPPPFVPPEQVEQASSQAASEVERQQALRDKFGEAQKAEAAYPGQVEQYGKDMAAFQEATQNAPVTYSGAGGSFTIDPRERIMAAREQSKRRANQLLATLGNVPGLEEEAPRIAGEVGAGRDLEHAFAGVDTRAKLAQKAEGQPPLSEGRFAQEKELKRIGAAAGAAAQAPFKADTANRQDLGALRQAFKEWKNTVQLGIDSKSMKRLQTISENVNSPNTLQQKEAAESLVSVFRGGGQVTKASQDYLLSHLSGIVGDAQTWLQKRATGGFGSRDLAVLREAANAALREQREKSDAYLQSARDTFGEGSGWEMLGGNVNHLVKGALRQFGYEAPDIYASDSAPVTPGSGKRQRKPAKGAPPQPEKTAAPSGLPPGAVPVGKTKDGRNAYRLPNGKLVAE